jgi:hypothetical protein
MTLHGYIYMPNGSGPFPVVLWNHGSERLPGEEPALADFYVGHGYVFFIPHRHGQGESSDAGDYIMDLEQLVQNIGMGPTCVTNSMSKFRDDTTAMFWQHSSGSKYKALLTQTKSTCPVHPSVEFRQS